MKNAILGGFLVASLSTAAMAAEGKWVAFNPGTDPYRESPIDLRELNEKQAGEGGFIGVKGSDFVHAKTGERVRFWAVNGPPHELGGKELADCARMLAKHGVNMVRVHGGYFDEKGDVDLKKVRHAMEIVQAMKKEGIYTHFSIYFPLWITPKSDNPYLKGYNGKQHPFAALYFDPDFQAQYRKWWEALLTTPDDAGKKLIDEPAVSSLEIINEDSYFFWTFAENNIPDAELKLLEKQLGDYVKQKHGSIENALKAWGGNALPRDNASEGRLAFRPLWSMFNEKTARDKETARFLAEAQRGFYEGTYRFLKDVGFKGVITASNWATASPQVFGPIEKWTYTATDFIDRHGYFGADHKGDNAGWSVRNGHTYMDRSALRFESEDPKKPKKQFVHPVMDPSYDNKPSMISETTFNRPNRYRTESPLYYAAYGALQGSDCVMHFALDGAKYSVKPGYWMQPWTLMSPTQMGQFPAAALIYRKGLVDQGELLVDLNLKVDDILNLKGTPLAQDAAFDELRLKDVPRNGQNLQSSSVIDPLVHYVGRTNVNFVKENKPSKIADLSRFIDRKNEIVISSNGELKLDYGKGVLTINAAGAQGVVGNLKAAGEVKLKDLTISSDMDLGAIVVVALDGKSIAQSQKVLLQVMSEEESSGWKTEPAGEKLKKIVSIGKDPWMVKEMSGRVSFSGETKVSALDLNGYPVKELGDGKALKLETGRVYYLISK